MPQKKLFSVLRVATLAGSIVSLVFLSACAGTTGGSTGGNPSPNPAPTVTSLSPTSATAGAASLTLTVNGTNFISSSTVLWNGSARSTTFVSSVELQAAISASDVASAGTAPVTVSSPAPGGGTSSSLAFTISNPAPVIGSLNPSSIVAGSGAFTLSVNGSNFTSDAVVEWNSASRTTTYVSGTSLQAAITMADVASAGSAQVTVFTPTPGGGTSSALTFAINASGGSGLTTTPVNQAANDLVWDSVNKVIYLSVPSTATANANTIAVLNPSLGTIVSAKSAGSEPDALAIAGDSSYLYVGLDGQSTVQRFTLPALATDISYPLGTSKYFGPYFALDLQVAPGAPHTTAVSLGAFNVSPAAEGGVTIFDDATPRPTTASVAADLYDSIQWGSDATALYAANNEDSGFDFYTLAVSPSGVVLSNDYRGIFDRYFIRIHYDQGTKLVYSDDGHVVNPATGLPAGSFAASGVMVPDSALNAAFFLGQTQAQIGSQNFTLESFDLTHFTAVNSTVITNVNGTPKPLIRWGQNGLAFNTNAGEVYIVQGGFVGLISNAVPANLEPVRRTWPGTDEFSLPLETR
ncbi:MAG: hypothetical protein WA785_09795 [Candidatus Acidiferrales bacterium]